MLGAAPLARGRSTRHVVFLDASLLVGRRGRRRLRGRGRGRGRGGLERDEGELSRLLHRLAKVVDDGARDAKEGLASRARGGLGPW